LQDARGTGVCFIGIQHDTPEGIAFGEFEEVDHPRRAGLHFYRYSTGNLGNSRFVARLVVGLADKRPRSKRYFLLMFWRSLALPKCVGVAAFAFEKAVNFAPLRHAHSKTLGRPTPILVGMDGGGFVGGMRRCLQFSAQFVYWSAVGSRQPRIDRKSQYAKERRENDQDCLCFRERGFTRRLCQSQPEIGSARNTRGFRRAADSAESCHAAHSVQRELFVKPRIDDDAPPLPHSGISKRPLAEL
jgi:hypothetical protein